MELELYNAKTDGMIRVYNDLADIINNYTHVNGASIEINDYLLTLGSVIKERILTVRDFLKMKELENERISSNK